MNQMQYKEQKIWYSNICYGL